MILERGALLNNRYTIIEILGQGGMGSVYRATDENLGMEVAVKDNLFTTEEYARQFRREAVILAGLRHPNMPRVTDHFVIEGQGQYLVMDYIEGEDLRQRMDRAGLLSEEEVVMIGAAICDALTYLATRNPPIVHRDIKPGNVKITPQGEIFLVDFGLAKVSMGSQETTTGARAMTPGYSPPEQYGTARTDQRSDIFSLGATLYAALTGAIPEDALSRAMGQCELTSIRKYNPRVSRRLASAVEKAIEVRPENRYSTAEEFKNALLTVRGVSRRKTGEYFITPPPSAGLSSGLSSSLHSVGGGEAVLSAPANAFSSFIRERTPQPLRISTPLENTGPRPASAGGRGCLLVALILFLVLGGGGLAAYVYDPTLPSQARAWVAPILPEAPVALGIFGPSTPTPQPSATVEPVPSSTVPPAETDVTAEVVLPVETEEPTPQPSATFTPSPTPSPSPTMIGGSSGQIAFASDRTGEPQIYVMNIEGSDLRQMTDMPEGACQPEWSPDGHRLIFISPCNGNQETYPGSAFFVINADGTDLMPLPSQPGGDFDPAWSPDGRYLLFTSIRNGGRPRIYKWDLEKLKEEPPVLLSDEYNRDLEPDWSPDGERIAFISTRKGITHIYLMDADGSNQETFSQSGSSFNFEPAWSLDGQVILFTQQPARGAVPYLYAAPLEQEGEYQEYRISSDLAPMREGRYSPDGFWIAFESWPEGSNHDIYIMTAYGANRSRLTSDPSTEFDPAWRPVPTP